MPFEPQTYDVEAIKAKTDLVALVERNTSLRRVATTGGGEYAGPCPKCGGRDRFHVSAQGWWFCRQCHSERGDAIAYLVWRDGLSFDQACERLVGEKAGSSVPRLGEKGGTVPAPRQSFTETDPPGEEWQERAQAFVSYAQAELHKSPEALAYLRAARGLDDVTIQEAELGYNPRDWHVHPHRWGMTGQQVWLPQGWVLPCRVEGLLFYLKIRRPEGQPKYVAVSGSKLTLYGLDFLARDHYTEAIICEGEFDAMLLRQYVGRLCGCLALGGATKGLDMQSVARLVAIRGVWVCLDADSAGGKGTQKLLEVSARVHPLPLPVGNDVTDAWRAGHDLTRWVVQNIGPQDAERRLLWCEHWLHKLWQGAPEALSLALLEEYNRLVKGANLTPGPYANLTPGVST